MKWQERIKEARWAKRHGTTEQIFYGVARRYDIRIRAIPTPRGAFLEDHKAATGPRGHGCSPSTRTIFLNQRGQKTFEAAAGIASFDARPEDYIHELAHVLTQPPWQDISDTPEDFILMQFERSLAKAVFSPRVYERVVSWQHCTEVAATGMTLGEHTDQLDFTQPYPRLGWWRAGFIFCRKLGILDENNQPTYRWPAWERISKKTANRIMEWYFGEEPTSLVTIAQEL